MKKLVMALVALAAIVAVATPALAEIKVNGYYRLQGIATNSDDSSVNFNGPNAVEPATQSLIDQRLRMKVTNTLNENVKIVWYGEVDGTFGATGATGGGTKDGGPGGDRVSVETKNAYLDFKIPNSMFSVKTGLQGVGGRYQGLILADDWSAIKVGMDINDTTKLTLLYSKPSEGVTNQWDDVDFYNVSFDTKAGDVKIGADLAWFDNNAAGGFTAAGGGDSPLFGGLGNNLAFDLYLAAIKADAKIGDIGVDGFFIYATGSEDNPAGGGEQDLSAYAASVHVSAKVADIGLGGRVIYMSGDDNTADADTESFIPNLGGNYDFAKENLMIFMTDAYYNNGPGGRLAVNAATNNGSGLLGLTAQANFNFDDIYLKTGVGYFQALETQAGGEDDMGFEIAARVGTKVAGNVDCSIAGAYAVMGDYWIVQNGLASTPDDIFKVSAMVNVGF
jgi:hypothetical protein